MFTAPKSNFDTTQIARIAVPEHKLRDYPVFDWLRILLASAVFWVHAGSVQHLNFAGDLFVQIFFALSGFLIGGIIIRMDRSDLPRFFYNRTIRIWVPFFAAVGLSYLVAYTKEGYSPYFWESLGYDLTFTHNFFIQKTPEVIAALPLNGTGSHFWSIAVEEQFYLMAPMLIIFVPLAKYWVTWVFIAILATTIGMWYGSVSAGVLAVMLQIRFGNWHIHPLAGMILIGVGALVSVCWATGTFEYRYLVPILSIVIVLLCARPGLRTRLGIWAGGISFPMYLNHWIGLFVAGALASKVPQIGLLTADIIGFALSIFVAAFAYRLIDHNLYKYRSSLYTPALGYIAMTSAYALMALGLVLGLYIIGPLDGPPPAM